MAKHKTRQELEKLLTSAERSAADWERTCLAVSQARDEVERERVKVKTKLANTIKLLAQPKPRFISELPSDLLDMMITEGYCGPNEMEELAGRDGLARESYDLIWKWVGQKPTVAFKLLHQRGYDVADRLAKVYLSDYSLTRSSSQILILFAAVRHPGIGEETLKLIANKNLWVPGSDRPDLDFDLVRAAARLELQRRAEMNREAEAATKKEEKEAEPRTRGKVASKKGRKKKTPTKRRGKMRKKCRQTGWRIM